MNKIAQNTRNKLAGNGNLFRMNAAVISTQDYTMSIADALRRVFGNGRSAVKDVANVAGSNLRTAENWLQAKNAPQGPYLMALMAHSEEVTEQVLRLAHRPELADATKRAAAVAKINAALKALQGE